MAVLIDLFSRRVVGWATSDSNDRALALDALAAALRARRPPPGVVHHTDRGSPYAIDDYRRALKNGGLVASMRRTGDCYDNAVAESFFASLKAPIHRVSRRFTIRCNDSTAPALIVPLHAAIGREAPNVRLRFIGEGEEDAASLRDGRVDLDVGVIDISEPELRTRFLAADKFVVVARRSHRLARGLLTPQRLAREMHVSVRARERRKAL